LPPVEHLLLFFLEVCHGFSLLKSIIGDTAGLGQRAYYFDGFFLCCFLLFLWAVFR